MLGLIQIYITGKTRKSRSHELKVATVAISGVDEISRGHSKTRGKSRSRIPSDGKDKEGNKVKHGIVFRRTM